MSFWKALRHSWGWSYSRCRICHFSSEGLPTTNDLGVNRMTAYFKLSWESTQTRRRQNVFVAQLLCCRRLAHDVISVHDFDFHPRTRNVIKESVSTVGKSVSVDFLGICRLGRTGSLLRRLTEPSRTTVEYARGYSQQRNASIALGNCQRFVQVLRRVRDKKTKR